MTHRARKFASFYKPKSAGGSPTPPGPVLPPDYNPATDELWIAQPGYVYSDNLGNTLMTGAGNALSWRSLNGFLVIFNSVVAWNGIDRITKTGTEHADANIGSNSAAETILVAAQSATGTGAQRIYDSVSVGNRRSLYILSANLVMYAGSSLNNGSPSTNPFVHTGVWDGTSSINRVNGVETIGNVGTSPRNGLRIGAYGGVNPIQHFIGDIYGIWYAPGRAFNAAQRATNEAAFEALTGIVLS